MPINYQGIIGTRVPKRENYQPYALADIRTADEASDEWAKHWRPNGPGWKNPSPTNPTYLSRAYGGSDMGTLMGVSHFKTRLQLFDEKVGIKPVVERNANGWAKDRGHLYETITAKKYHLFRRNNKEKVTLYIEGQVYEPDGSLKTDASGNPIDESISMMIYRDGRLKGAEYKSNADFVYPWALANCDGLIKEADGEIGLLEIKTTSPSNFSVIENWKVGIVPESYYYQTVYYMAIMNVMFCDIVCSWGQELDTMAVIRIYRDYDVEEELFSKVEEFDDYVEQGIEPDTTDEDGELLLSYYYEKFGPVKEDEPFVELPDNAKYRNIVRQAMDIAKRKEEAEKKLKELEKEEAGIYAQLYPVFKTSSYGQFRLDDKQVVGITLKTPMKRAEFDEERFKAEHPTEYAECLRFSSTELSKLDKKLKASYMLPAQPDLENATKMPSFKLKTLYRSATV